MFNLILMKVMSRPAQLRYSIFNGEGVQGWFLKRLPIIGNYLTGPYQAPKIQNT